MDIRVLQQLKKKKWHSTAKCKACVCHLKQSAVIYLEANVCYICKIERMYSWIDVPTHKAFIYDNAKCCSGHYMKRRRAVYESSSVWPTASIYTLNITATNSLVEIFMKSSMFSCNGLANYSREASSDTSVIHRKWSTQNVATMTSCID